MANPMTQEECERIDELLLLIHRNADDEQELEALVGKMIKQRRNKQRVASFATDEVRVSVEERESRQLASIAEKAYAARRRLMNDIWTETNNGVSRDFVGSLHPSHTVRYPK
jgi:hypothetical protein